jgi:hypothetical protein
MTSDFTLGAYSELVGAFRTRHYAIRAFDDVDAYSRHVVIRHDVDMSLKAATRVAELEHELGVRAIYFVLVRSEIYHPFTAEASLHLRKLVDLGHKVGLHFDASLYSREPDELEEPCRMECELLENFLGQRIDMISFHRPVPALVGLDRRFAGRRHTYEPRFVTDIGYCSDSKGGWFRGHPLQHKSVVEGRALQLLTHPIWWDARAGETAVEKLNRFALGRFDQLRVELARNCTPYREGLSSLFRQGTSE